MSDQLLKPTANLKHPSSNNEDDAIERRTLRDYYIILRERVWIAAPVAVLCALAVFYYQSREVPQFSSHASLKFEKSDRVVGPNTAVVNIEVENEAMLNTYISEIKSDKISEDVVHSLTLDDQNVLLEPYKKGLPAGAALPSVTSAMGSLNVQARRSSFVVDLKVVHRSPQAAQLLASRYVDRFIQSVKDKVSGGTNKAYDFLTDKAAELQNKFTQSNQALQDFMKSKGMVSLDTSTSIVQTNLSTANAALQAARQRRSDLEDQLKLIERYQRENRDLMEISYLSNFNTVPELRRTRDDLKRQQEKLIDTYYEEWPALKTINADLDIINGQLDRAVDLAIADLRANLDRARTLENSCQDEYNFREKAVFQFHLVEVEFKTLSDIAVSDHSNYLAILNRQHETDTNRALTDVPVSQLDTAKLSLTPFSPDPSRITKTAIGVGVLVFLAIAVGLSFVDDRIKSAWDVETFIGSTMLGIIPDLANLKDEDKYRLVLGDAQGAGVEPFLGLYSSVKIHSKLDFPKSLLITSTVPGEGKTLVSCNLAGSFARHGRRTLIIDCDLRRPMLHRHFNKPNETGLIAWYDNGASLDGDLLANPWLGITSVGENLSLITAGGRSKSPTQFLESPAFAQLIERLKKLFDLIVIDSPPMGAVTDALLIAERADEVLYVCRFNRAYRKHIRLYIKALRHGKNEILGIVLNGLSPRRIEYYSNYRYYRSYKKYYGTQG